jgi:tRNA 2-thiouridine synthesizing protein C
VEELFVSSRSLAERGLEEATLALPAERLDDTALTLLLDRFDLVVTI